MEPLFIILSVLLFITGGLAIGKIQYEARQREKESRRDGIKKRGVKIHKKQDRPARKW